MKSQELMQLAAASGVLDVPAEALWQFAQLIAQRERRRAIHICLDHAQQPEPKRPTDEGAVRYDQDRLTARVLANKIGAG